MGMVDPMNAKDLLDHALGQLEPPDAAHADQEITAVLNTVEQDHVLVLENIRALKEAVTALMRPPTKIDVRAVLEQLCDSQCYFNGRFESHMEEEERTLFPFLARQKPCGPRVVAQLRQEHGEIRHLREKFGNSLDLALKMRITRLRKCCATC